MALKLASMTFVVSCFACASTQAASNGRAALDAADEDEVSREGIPTIVFRTRTGGGGYLNPPVVVGDTVYVSSSGRLHNEPDAADGLYAIDRLSGEIRWHAHTDTDANALTVHDGRVFAGTDGGRLFVVDAVSGEVRATAPAPSSTSPTTTRRGAPFRPTELLADGCCSDEEWPLTVGSIFGAPLPIAEGVVFADSRGNVLYWHADQLEVIVHEFEQFGGFRAPLVAVPGAPGEFVYASLTGEVGRADLRARVAWRATLARQVYAAPLVLADRVIFTHSHVPRDRAMRLPVEGRRGLVRVDPPSEPGPNLIALRLASGALDWWASGSSLSGRSHTHLRTPAVIASGRVYWQDPLEGILSLDPASGALRSRAAVGACHETSQWAGLVVADGHLAYAPRLDGILYAVDLRTSTRRWALDFGDTEFAGEPMPEDIPCEGLGEPLYTSPAIAPDGMLYLMSGHGVLYGLRLAD